MRKKILFVNDEMVIGGVSKVLNNLLNNLDLDKYEIDLLVLHKHGEMLKDVPKGINIIEGSKFFNIVDVPFNKCQELGFSFLLKKMYLFLLMKFGIIGYRIKKERRRMKLDKYDVEIAFKEGFCSVFTAYSNSDIKINWIHADYKVKNYASNYMNLMPKVLSYFDYHVAVSKVAARSFEEIFKLKNKVLVIHNIIESIDIINGGNVDINYRDKTMSFISVGRLHEQKNYKRLINVHNKLINDGFKIKTYIVGDGELKNEMIKLIKDFNISDSFILLGSKTNPFAYVKQADCFVLSSNYEGLPTVIFESMILKTPVISCKVAGIDEQLQDKYGMIVENSDDALYEGMKLYLQDNSYEIKYMNNLVNYSYDKNEIIKKIDFLFSGEVYDENIQ